MSNLEHGAHYFNHFNIQRYGHESHSKYLTYVDDPITFVPDCYITLVNDCGIKLSDDVINMILNIDYTALFITNKYMVKLSINYNFDKINNFNITHIRHGHNKRSKSLILYNIEITWDNLVQNTVLIKIKDVPTKLDIKLINALSDSDNLDMYIEVLKEHFRSEGYDIQKISNIKINDQKTELRCKYDYIEYVDRTYEILKEHGFYAKSDCVLNKPHQSIHMVDFKYTSPFTLYNFLHTLHIETKVIEFLSSIDFETIKKFNEVNFNHRNNILNHKTTYYENDEVIIDFNVEKTYSSITNISINKGGDKYSFIDNSSQVLYTLYEKYIDITQSPFTNKLSLR